jgi:hypothetical protein
MGNCYKHIIIVHQQTPIETISHTKSSSSFSSFEETRIFYISNSQTIQKNVLSSDSRLIIN